VKLSNIKASDLPAYFEKAKETKGMIVDIRNDPSDFMPFAMGQYFAVKPTPFVSFTFPDLSNPGAFRFGAGPLIQPGPLHYKGRLVVLVDETVASARAEWVNLEAGVREFVRELGPAGVERVIEAAKLATRRGVQTSRGSIKKPSSCPRRDLSTSRLNASFCSAAPGRTHRQCAPLFENQSADRPASA
jgi:hypothetical protein